MGQPQESSPIEIDEIPGAAERPADTSIRIIAGADPALVQVTVPPRMPARVSYLLCAAFSGILGFGLIAGVAEFRRHLSEFPHIMIGFVITGLIVMPLLTCWLFYQVLRTFATAEIVAVSSESLIYRRVLPFNWVQGSFDINQIRSFQFLRDPLGLRQPQLIVHADRDGVKGFELFEALPQHEKEWMGSVLNSLLSHAKSGTLGEITGRS